MLHCIDVHSPSLFVLFLLSTVIANAALKHPSGRASVNYGTIMDNLGRLPYGSYDKEIIKKDLSSFLLFLLCIGYFLFVVSVGLGE